MTGDPTGDDRAKPRTGWQILAPLIDLVTPMAVRVAATLRLADLLRDGPVPLSRLAESAGCDADGLARLLRHLIAQGMFSEPETGVIALNDTAALLDSNHPSGMQVWLDLTGFGGRMDLAFTELLHSVRTGEPAWSRVFGSPFWEYLAGHPDMSASFDEVMSAGAEYARDDLAAFDWSRAGQVVDVGGGTGTLLAALLRAAPTLHGTLVDLPETVGRARQLLSGEGFGPRLEFVGQSFFDPLPAGRDVYVLNSVLHDWPDDEALSILQRCAEAAGADGRVVIIEESGERSASHAEMDLRMLVLCGGRERTVAEYTDLAARAGLAVATVRTTPLGQSGIELVPDGR